MGGEAMGGEAKIKLDEKSGAGINYTHENSLRGKTGRRIYGFSVSPPPPPHIKRLSEHTVAGPAKAPVFRAAPLRTEPHRRADGPPSFHSPAGRFFRKTGLALKTSPFRDSGGGVEMFYFFRKKPRSGKMFNILDFDTWEYASDSVFVLNGKTVIEMGENAEAFTEKNMVKAITDVIRGISRNDGAKEKIQKKGRKNIIERLINNMALGMSFTESIDEMIHWLNSSGLGAGQDDKTRQQERIPKGVFDPRDPDTYQFAADRPLVIDGVRIFRTFEDMSE
jgi:hypothetical protein